MILNIQQFVIGLDVTMYGEILETLLLVGHPSSRPNCNTVSCLLIQNLRHFEMNEILKNPFACNHKKDIYLNQLHKN